MAFDVRALAIATAGFTAFVNLYSPQALLPELSREFGVGAGEISSLMTATTAAIALTAPFTGVLADVLGRKRLITIAAFAVVVPTLMMTLAASVPQLVFLRFVQGLLLPPIFTVAVAYVGDEWPPAEVPRVAGLFVSGSSVGGFCGRFFTGAIADLIGWRVSFAAVALLTLAGGLIVTLALPRERSFVRSGGFLVSVRQMLSHLRNPRLLAIYAVGFGTLFNFIATFTYVSFHLAGAPYFFSSTLLGALFATYLAGSVLVPWVGRVILLFGRRRFILGIIAIWVCGALHDARAADQRNHHRPDDLRGLRHGVPGGFDRLRHHHRQGGALVRRRPLCFDVLHRRQRRRFSDGIYLECCRLDRVRCRHRCRSARHGGGCLAGVGAFADLRIRAK